MPYLPKTRGTGFRHCGFSIRSFGYLPLPYPGLRKTSVQSINDRSTSEELRYSATLRSPRGLDQRLAAAKSYIQGFISKIRSFTSAIGTFLFLPPLLRISSRFAQIMNVYPSYTCARATGNSFRRA